MRLLDRVQELEYNKGKTLRQIDRDLFETVVYYIGNPIKWESRLMDLLELHERG